MASATMPRRRLSWPDHRTLWRWHFYAGLFCIPFVLLLSCTGLVYLFKPQIDDLIDWRCEHLVPSPHPAGAAAETGAAIAAIPGSRLLAYELPRTDRSAARVIVLRGHDAIRVYVDPADLSILKTVAEEQRFERIVFNLHGQLLLGDRGSLLVELAASWAIVMILTGLCLWWPRPADGRLRAAGLLYPRLSAGGRVFWRDLHAVTGLWVSAFMLFLLVSGLPWAYAWGNYLAGARALMAPRAAAPASPAPVRDWQIGHVPARVEIAGDAMAAMPEMAMMLSAPSPAGHAPDPAAPDLAAIDAVIRAVRPLHLAYPVLLTPPKAGRPDWGARSDAQDRIRRTTLVVAPDGRVLSRVDFALHPLLDRIIGIGVAAHEGHLFGWLNQLLNAIVALSMILVGSSAVMLWLRRRPDGRLGAPPAPGERPVAASFLILVGVLAIMLPLLGSSMVGVVLVERIVLRRIPPVRDWLGLRHPTRIKAG